MHHINEYSRQARSPEDTWGDLKPHDVFDFVAGTSTGGLIAVMLGKLGMSIEECIAQYKKLSVKIFKKKHLRSRFTGGLAQHKYSGKCLRECVSNLIHERGFPRDMPMLCGDSKDSIAWYI